MAPGSHMTMRPAMHTQSNAEEAYNAALLELEIATACDGPAEIEAAKLECSRAWDALSPDERQTIAYESDLLDHMGQPS